MAQHAASKKGDAEHNSARIRHLKPVKQPEKADIFSQITPKQEEFLETLLLRHFISEAAEQLDISERTARRWLTLPPVIKALEALRQERRDAIRNKIEMSLDFATDLLERTLHDAAYPQEGHYIERERADKYVFALLKYAVDQREIDDLRRRIAQLEAEPKATAQSVVDATVTHSDEEE
jgi:hypothetical protein